MGEPPMSGRWTSESSGESPEESEPLVQPTGVRTGRRSQLLKRAGFVCTAALALGAAASLAWRPFPLPSVFKPQQPLGAAKLATLQLSEVPAPKHPHVVVIVIDDVGYGDLKPWAKNNTIVKAPNIERLAGAGMILDRHYAQVMCTPSRATLLTGRYPIRYGLQTQVLQPNKPYGLPINETTMAQILKKAGYATHMVGKWHLGFYTWPATPTFRGFDTWVGISEGESDHYDYTIDMGSRLPGVNVLFQQKRPNCGQNCTKILKFDHNWSASLWTENAVQIVEDHNVSVPLFLYLCYTGPHAPCQIPPEPYASQYPDVEDPKRKVYAEMLSATDGGIGEVTDALSKKGMLNDTILVVFSDNGGPVGFPGQTDRSKAGVCEPFGRWGADTGASNYPFRGGKAQPFEGGVRTPAFIHYPRHIKAGSRFAGLAHVSDWLPTILAAASVNDAANRAEFPLDGINLWSALRANSLSPRTELLVDIDAGGGGTGGAIIRNWTKLFVGDIFNKTNFWALPPEVALAQKLPVEDDPIFAPAMYCSQGCVFDLKADPQEKHPRNATADDEDLMDAYMAYQKAAVPNLYDQVGSDPESFAVYKEKGSTWPYVVPVESSERQ